jgi:hypothetical protein
MNKEMSAWRSFLLTEIKARTASRQLTRIFMLMIRTLLQEKAQSGLVYDEEEFTSKFKKWKSEGKIILLVAGKYGHIFPEGLDTSPTLLNQWLKDGLPQDLLNRLKLRLTLTPATEKTLELLPGENVFSIRSGGGGKTTVSVALRYDPNLIKEKGEQDLSQLLSILDGVVYHEFVHFLQLNGLIQSSGRDSSVEPDAPGIIKQFKKQIEDGSRKDTTAFVTYMLQPAEIEGYARGFYLDSRNLGVPWEQLIDQFLQEVIESRGTDGQDIGGFEMTPAQLNNFADELYTKVKPKLIEYAKKNLPCASMNNGRPVSTNCKKPSKINKVSAQTMKKMKTMWGGVQGLIDKLRKKSPF